MTRRFSRGTTATMEKIAPSGFQHFVQPQAWLCATCPLIATLTGSFAHLHTKVPPEGKAACEKPRATLRIQDSPHPFWLVCDELDERHRRLIRLPRALLPILKRTKR